MPTERRRLVPTLDGTRLTVADSSGARRHAFADGTHVPADREVDVLYVREGGPRDRLPWWDAPLDHVDASQALPLSFVDEGPRAVTVGDETFTSDDVAALLGSLPSPTLSSPTAVDPGFFHTSLKAWLGEGSSPERFVVWPYGFWAASVDPIDVGSLPRVDAVAFEARIFRGDKSEPATFRYWLVVGEDETVTASGWLGDAPDLLAEDAATFDEPPLVSADDLFRIVDDG
jgi:hypothetical protein